MKRVLLYVLFAAITICTHAQLNMPQLSPTQTITENFGLGKIELTYSRPSLKGRAVFGNGSELAPVGEVWRTGANSATKLTFSDTVTIDNKVINPGSYALFTIPGSNDWTIIINKGPENDNPFSYKKEDDIVRFNVPSMNMGNNVEIFTMQFMNITAESCDLILVWGNTAVSFPITTHIKDRLRANVETALASDKKPYWDAANFYYQMDNNYSKAYENVQMAVKENPDAYYMYLLKARVEKQLGKKEEAKASAEKCKQLAEGKNAEYIKLSNALIASL